MLFKPLESHGSGSSGQAEARVRGVAGDQRFGGLVPSLRCDAAGRPAEYRPPDVEHLREVGTGEVPDVRSQLGCCRFTGARGLGDEAAAVNVVGAASQSPKYTSMM